MSTITMAWTPELIRKVVRCLDEKTGLDIASWTITMNRQVSRLGYCNYSKKILAFSEYYMNDPEFRESEAYNLIRHEYAHAYVYLTNLNKWIPSEKNAKHHGSTWKYACDLLKCSPRRAYSTKKLLPELDGRVANIMYFAEDLEKIDVKKHLAKWDCVPMYYKKRMELDQNLKIRFKENGFFEAGDECFEMSKGHGVVLDTYPDCIRKLQMVQVQYEDGAVEVTTGGQLLKKVDGVLVI